MSSPNLLPFAERWCNKIPTVLAASILAQIRTFVRIEIVLGTSNAMFYALEQILHVGNALYPFQTKHICARIDINTVRR